MRNNEMRYNHSPTTTVKGDFKTWTGFQTICLELSTVLAKYSKKNTVLVIETYPGVRIETLRAALDKYFEGATIFCADDFAMNGQEIQEKFAMLITEDRVFGRMAAIKVEDYYEKSKLELLRNKLTVTEGLTIVFGTGASLAVEADLTVYVDVARWEIQQRMRSGEIGNWNDTNLDEDILRKYKRGFFLDWRAADRLKVELFDKIDYYVDDNELNNPKMVHWSAYCSALEQMLQGPFRFVPYFDPGVWGGQWMKKNLGLDAKASNFAWAFDGVAEENSLYLQFGEVRVETPAINAVLKYPMELLGELVYSRFGAELPIRFDFLDTMDGQNLSLQVHPNKEYIKKQFGMDYTQEESYYLLDAKNDAVVYLGMKDGVKPTEFIGALEEAQTGEVSLDAARYINTIPAKKHDHFLIPSGTVHCSGADSMILEISLCAYIFTFKLWDWGRLGLDAKPRPVHIDHGEKVINWNRPEKWVAENLVNQLEPLIKTKTHTKERTGLYKTEQIYTERDWFTDFVDYDNSEQTVNMLNLVEGDKVVVESLDDSFEAFEVHYVETFVIPAQIKRFRISNVGESERVAILRARIM
ncbi:class I mannose-6-phosphate isomerase [Listeria ivanovii]|uniref:Class I mannose-6-phosphate isomerase n=1 Tax=Listeria ivanovii subsp. londoniensis TaxID=202752 RepID=A0ABS1G2X5_LISIV|nr:class I mannose-6-phosphate isomerase [Listeria ivanovii]AIS58915.1 mannose-6-phosphate isomerase [Listeria ivanovii subsp. londoniensis]AIS61718.1 mannose-6-phosphate isomerase [Listeria ivanovii subsp. londoniensis]MBC2254572.1 mannose-6-phosphate isomerase [Listeria ivanovii]MBK1961230.1 class I mannose-6-phosphate isomerase [Listeria ivanovii subsp. londoniensis]MBK1965838.1 class I mannose-6-phosphate isomerase [Listeria ivanovii subsp. londoniensis]